MLLFQTLKKVLCCCCFTRVFYHFFSLSTFCLILFLSSYLSLFSRLNRLSLSLSLSLLSLSLPLSLPLSFSRIIQKWSG